MAFHKACKDAGLSTPSKSVLFKDFHNTLGILAHPSVLVMKKNKNKLTIDDDSGESESDSNDENSKQYESATNSDMNSAYENSMGIFMFCNLSFHYLVSIKKSCKFVS